MQYAYLRAPTRKCVRRTRVNSIKYLHVTNLNINGHLQTLANTEKNVMKYHYNYLM